MNKPTDTEKWAAEFPYHWDQDDVIARRQLLKFSVFTSGALFLAAVGLAVIGLFKRTAQNTGLRPIARTSDLNPGEARYFRYPQKDDEAVLIRLADGRFVAYSQRCTHLSCSVVYRADNSRLFCPCHDGAFDVATGEPVAGPPSRRLPRITLKIQDEIVSASELIP